MEEKRDMFGKEKGRSRRSEEENKKSTNLPFVGIAAAAVILTLGAGIGFYCAKSGAYQETFMPNTTINGIAVEGKNVEEVKALIEEHLNGYELKIMDRTGAGEVIKKDEIGLRTEFEGGLEQILEIQEPMMWIKSLWTEVDYQISTMLVYDETLLEERVRGLSCMNAAQMEEPQDAYLSEYQYDSNSYEIVPETPGTELIEDRVLEVISQAVLELQEKIDLDAAGCYTKAAVSSDDAELTALASALNHYAGVVVTHRFGELEEVLDGDTIHEWLTVDGQTVTLDETKPKEYVRALAKKYNTAYGKRPFLTTYGDVVTIPGGSYGWRMDEAKETEAVFAAVKEGAIVTREPEWTTEGASHGEYDYGDTYVEVNLTGQHLFFYKNGELLVECDFVSGNASKNWSTPAGIFPITYKQRNATLRGENYATPVSYWMPFNGNIGLHDADWRGNFGGAIYKTNGSHGCVNLPPKAAKIIYENIAKGDPVICYHLEGTETKKTTGANEINTSGAASVNAQVGNSEAAGGNASAGTNAGGGGTGNSTKPAETAPAETKPAETKPAETAPAETVPVETVPSETETAAPETSAGPSGPSASTEAVLRPENGPGALTETRPAGPGSGSGAVDPVTEPTPDAQGSSVAPEGGTTVPPTMVPAITETRPAGEGPGSGPVNNAPVGPGSSTGTGTASGPGSSAGVGPASGPGSGPGSNTATGPGAA